MCIRDSIDFFFFQAEDGIRDLVRSRGLGDVYKRQDPNTMNLQFSIPGTAVPGVYDLVVTTTDTLFIGSNLQTYTLPASFTITPPDGFISGKVYFDANLNGVFDTGETPLTSQYLTLTPGNVSATTDANGDYTFGVMNGIYTITWNRTSGISYLLSSDSASYTVTTVSYTHLRAHETVLDLVCRLLLEKKKNTTPTRPYIINTLKDITQLQTDICHPIYESS